MPLSHSAHKAQLPCPDPHPLPRSCWEKLPHGKTALRPNQIPRAFPGSAEDWHCGAKSALSRQGPSASVESRNSSPAWVMLLVCCETEQRLSSWPQFPHIYNDGAGTEPETLNCVPVARDRIGVLGRSPREKAQKIKTGAETGIVCPQGP